MKRKELAISWLADDVDFRPAVNAPPLSMIITEDAEDIEHACDALLGWALAALLSIPLWIGLWAFILWVKGRW